MVRAESNSLPGTGCLAHAGVTHLSTTLSYPCDVNDAVVAWMMSPGHGEVLPSLEDFLQRPAWHQRAACRGEGTETFVIPHGAQYEPRARELCAGCPVRPECLEVALADSELVGMWGGSTPTERRAMRRGRVA